MDAEFRPPRRAGFLIQISLILALSAVGGFFFFRATQDEAGLDFLLDMLIALILFSPIPLIGYRLYALSTAVYILRREGLQIRWGLRREDLPLNQLEWIRPATDLGFRLPLPWLRWPGALLGNRKMAELGEVEFLAADIGHLLLVATPRKVFAISPQEHGAFLARFQRLNELGTLDRLDPQSVYPKFVWGRVWEDRLARWLILLGLGIGLLLLGMDALAVPSLAVIDWTVPGSTAPAERLLLLPILDGLIWSLNLAVGSFLYRRSDDLRIAAYLLWGSSALTGVLLLIGSLVFIF